MVEVDKQSCNAVMLSVVKWRKRFEKLIVLCLSIHVYRQIDALVSFNQLIKGCVICVNIDSQAKAYFIHKKSPPH